MPESVFTHTMPAPFVGGACRVVESTSRPLGIRLGNSPKSRLVLPGATSPPTCLSLAVGRKQTRHWRRTSNTGCEEDRNGLSVKHSGSRNLRYAYPTGRHLTHA